MPKLFKALCPSGSKKLQVFLVLAAIGYCSLFFFQSRVFFYVQESSNFKDSVLSAEQVNGTKINLTDSNIKDQQDITTLDDIYISVKTTKHTTKSRLSIILKTWFQLAKNQTWFFTDEDNESLQTQTNGHMINTLCPSTHGLIDLCCKTSVEYDYYLLSEKRWFCHFDDDNYVNVPRLVNLLQSYNYQEDWYLGKTSIRKPIITYVKKRPKTFWFATGGAGYCISKSLALKMTSLAGNGNFISTCKSKKFPDDVAMGYIIEHMLQKSLTNIPEFHSQYEDLKLLSSPLRDQISFAYLLVSENNNKTNVVDVPGFDTRYDPTRFLSLHCFLFPDAKFCPR